MPAHRQRARRRLPNTVGKRRRRFASTVLVGRASLPAALTGAPCGHTCRILYSWPRSWTCRVLAEYVVDVVGVTKCLRAGGGGDLLPHRLALALAGASRAAGGVCARLTILGTAFA